MSDRLGVEQPDRDANEVVAADNAAVDQTFCCAYLNFGSNSPYRAADGRTGDRGEDFDGGAPAGSSAVRRRPTMRG
jgi:hypothetical protein